VAAVATSAMPRRDSECMSVRVLSGWTIPNRVDRQRPTLNSRGRMLDG
jgi:hypothetical protein